VAEQPTPEETAPSADRKRRRRRGKLAEDAPAEARLLVEPDSSPMVERPVDEEPPIAPVEAEEEPQPRRRNARAKAKPTAGAEVIAIPEPAPAEAAPAETADAAQPAKPARRSRAKKAQPAEQTTSMPIPEAPDSAVPTPDNDQSAEQPRRGWWQRTFG